MDLLGGYSSSGSSDDGNDSDNEVQIETKVNEYNDTRKTSIQTNNNENVQSQKINPKANMAKQNKRLLSLNAVLPSEIYARLTRSMQQQDSSSDDDDDEDDDVQNSGNKKGKGSVEKTNGKTVSIGFKSRKTTENTNVTGNKKKVRNKGIQSLLDDLKSNVASYKKERNTNDSEVKEEKMGMAFTNSVVSTIKKKNVNTNEVISIHDVKHTKTSFLPKSVDHDSTITTPALSNSQSYSNLAPKQVSSSNTIRRPMLKPGISSAPLVSSESSSRIPMYPTYTQPINNQISSNTENNEKNDVQSKKSKRQMQQALRSGNFSELSPDLLTSIPNPTLSSTSSMAVPTSGHQMSKSKYNLSNADIYDPKQGQMVSVASANSMASGGGNGQLRGKLRSKHQIHQLVQSARMLEANRRMQGSLGIGNNNVSSRRVDAKRKYGW